MNTNRRYVALLAALAAGVFVYVVGGLLADGRRDAALPAQEQPTQSEQPTPATDSHHDDPPTFSARTVPAAAQSAAERFTVDYAALTACQQPERALERLEAQVSEEILFQIAESRPREGGSACTAAGGTFNLHFERGRRGVWRVAATTEQGIDDALYFELRRSGRGYVVVYLEDPRLGTPA